jgi:hypothetical protein
VEKSLRENQNIRYTVQRIVRVKKRIKDCTNIEAKVIHEQENILS